MNFLSSLLVLFTLALLSLSSHSHAITAKRSSNPPTSTTSSDVSIDKNHHFPNKTLTRIAFGSCNKENLAQPMWDEILSSSPDLFLFEGDTVYADPNVLEIFRWPARPERIREKYEQQENRSEWKRFQQNIPLILSTVDDHDFGANDGNSHYEYKRESQKLFMDFFNVPKNSIRREREGFYSSWSFGTENGKRVKIILLDTRYFQTPERGELLGETQWNWLENELEFEPKSHRKTQINAENDVEITDTAEPDLILIASSIQLVPREHVIGENWVKFASERNRFLDLITRKNLNSAILITSGDVHYR